jgi:hypothetical protein
VLRIRLPFVSESELRTASLPHATRAAKGRPSK